MHNVPAFVLVELCGSPTVVTFDVSKAGTEWVVLNTYTGVLMSG